ncbi:hypothetical protein F383_30056 [Gossypium arboreum]|uniref:Uncharacterized protein n=1 Tax=Gossypium arboreum TaxID=29729 RepID=A0A0B0PDQ7_GOSAR|nr:hypothetical protein F383_30056 [Gossypium arboreum]
MSLPKNMCALWI